MTGSATKQSIFLLSCGYGLLRLARNDGVGVVIVRLDRTIQYSEAIAMEAKSCGILDTPHARGMTVTSCASSTRIGAIPQCAFATGLRYLDFFRACAISPCRKNALWCRATLPWAK
jgi:hypothetical protein